MFANSLRVRVVHETIHPYKSYDAVSLERSQSGLLVLRRERLLGDKLKVKPALRQEDVVRAGFGNDAVLQNVDAVGVLDRAQAVGDRDRRAVLRRLVERALDDLLGFRVERRGSPIPTRVRT